MRPPNVSDKVWDAYEAYRLHVAPLKGRTCRICRTAGKPSEGCEDGVRLYGTYRLAIVAPISVKAGK